MIVLALVLIVGTMVELIFGLAIVGLAELVARATEAVTS